MKHTEAMVTNDKVSCLSAKGSAEVVACQTAEQSVELEDQSTELSAFHSKNDPFSPLSGFI